MRFEAQIPIVNGATSPNPLTNPEDVPSQLVFEVGLALSRRGLPVTRLLFGLEGDAAETVTFTLWALDEATAPNSNADEPETPTTLAARRFYSIATGQIATNGALLSVAGAPGHGRYFVQVTAETVAADRVLHIAAAS